MHPPRTRFAASARIPDFSAKDLSAPDPDRTRSILSAFINFIKFTEQCGPFVSRLREKSTKAMDEREAVSLELTEIETKLQDLKAQMALDQPRCEELKKENAGLTAHLMATKEMQGALVKDIETLKKEKAAVLQRKAGRPPLHLLHSH
jgi:kinetochore protein Nuf2